MAFYEVEQEWKLLVSAGGEVTMKASPAAIYQVVPNGVEPEVSEGVFLAYSVYSPSKTIDLAGADLYARSPGNFKGGIKVTGAGTFSAGKDNIPLALKYTPEFTRKVTNAVSGLAAMYNTTGLVVSVSALPDETSNDVVLERFNVNGVDKLGDVVPTSPELAVNTNPGSLNNSVGSLVDDIEIGAMYRIVYGINSTAGNPFFGTGSPFDSSLNPLPSALGDNTVYSVAIDAEFASIMRVTALTDFSYISVKKVEWGVPVTQTGNEQLVEFAVSGSEIFRAYVPQAGYVFIAPWGDDTAGTGAFSSPLKTPTAAQAVAVPGDRIVFRPGVYDPFVITVGGDLDKPIYYTTLASEAQQAFIRGRCKEHVINGGDGTVEDESDRDAIYIDTVSNLHISNLVLEWTWRGGLFVRGAANAITNVSQQTRNITANNLLCRHVGASGITISGIGNSATPIAPSETGLLRTDTVLIERCTVYDTNKPTDWNTTGANVEAISVVGSVSNVITRWCTIHSSDQYAIDYKAGVRGGEIYGNTIYGIERYGIYLDAGRSFVEDIDIYDNDVYGCRNGIVLAREGTSVTSSASLRRIRVFCNRIRYCSGIGIYCQGHPGDAPTGDIESVHVFYNIIVNCNLSGNFKDVNLSVWNEPDWLSAGVVTDFRFVYNIVINLLQPIDPRIEFLDTDAEFTLVGNLIGVDTAINENAANSSTSPVYSFGAGSVVEGIPAVYNSRGRLVGRPFRVS